jgi:hypothetical protein
MSRQLTGVVLLITASWFTLAFAQGIPLVRLTGTLHPLQEKSPSGLHTLTVSIKGHEKLLSFSKVESSNFKIRRQLKKLFPPKLRLVGSDALLRTLQAPEINGVLLIIEGQLNMRDRMLIVTALEEASTEHQPPK